MGKLVRGWMESSSTPEPRTAMVTPFQQDLSLDEQALRRLVRRQGDARGRRETGGG